MGKGQRHRRMQFAYTELVERGAEPWFARQMVKDRDNGGWTPEEREAMRRFCAAANHVIDVHFLCNHA